MKLYSYVCKGCGRKFYHRKKNRKFCDYDCRSLISKWTQDQFRFHIMRAGSWELFEKYIGVPHGKTRKFKKVRDIDSLQNGRMVNIGGILVKRCPNCEVAWPLNKYHAQNLNASGVAGRCESCRINAKVKSDKEVVY